MKTIDDLLHSLTPEKNEKKSELNDKWSKEEGTISTVEIDLHSNLQRLYEISAKMLEDIEKLYEASKQLKEECEKASEKQEINPLLLIPDEHFFHE